MKILSASIFIILACLAGFFYFQGLDNWYLWQDEANSALLSKNILRWGYPFVFDGKNAIWPSISDVSSTHQYWILWGWLPLYVQALFFKLFGISTFSARFPSALIGWAFVLTTFLFARFQKCSILKSLFFPLLFIFCIPMTLFFRQCGYYAYTTILGFLLYFFLFQLNEGKKRTFLFLISSLCLVNVHMLSWGLIMAGLFCASWLESSRKSFLKLLFWAFFLALPFLLFYEAWTLFGIFGNHSSGTTASAYLKRLSFYEENLRLLFFPGWFMALFTFCSIYFWNHFEPQEKKNLKQILMFVGTVFLLVPFVTRFLYIRYILFAIPLFLVVIWLIQLRVLKQSKFWGILLGIALIVNSGIGYRNPPHFKEPLLLCLNFFHELTHDGEDINEVLCKYLNSNARPDDTVFCYYEEFPLQFYTSLLVRGGIGHIGIAPIKTWKEWGIDGLENPDWIVDRPFWNVMYRKDTLDSYLKQNPYEKITIPVEETMWGNRPYLPNHFFDTPPVTKPLVIYRKIKTSGNP